MAEWETAANMLIKHFQVALKGAVPFTFNWEGSEDGKEGTGSDGAKPKRKAKGKRKADPVVEAKEKAGMDDAGVEFMKNVCRLVRTSGKGDALRESLLNVLLTEPLRTRFSEITTGERKTGVRQRYGLGFSAVFGCGII